MGRAQARLLAPYIAPFRRWLVGLECYPGEPVRARRSHRALAMTNHYRHSTLAPLQGRRSQEHSRRRLERLATPAGCGGDSGEHTPVGDNAEASDSLAPVRRALRDHGAPVCNHGEMGATLWSAVADLTERRVAYAFGPPCETDYEDLPFPRDGKQGARRDA
jgi:hypothetical protein